MACIGQHPSAEVKVDQLYIYAHAYGLKTLVETGLYLGYGSGMYPDLQAWFDRYIVIDCQISNVQQARANFPAATIMYGDSGKLLPIVADGLREPALFWLDAHGIPEDFGEGSEFGPFPLLKELEAVARSPLPHVVLIDDLCMFGRDSWMALVGSPELEELRAFVDGLGVWKREERDCMMRLTPLHP